MHVRRRRGGWLAITSVAGALLAATDAGAVAVIVPETAITSPQYGPVYASVATPSIACNSDGCLAAWRGGRQGLSYRIWARRLRADGTPRDPAAFLVSVDNFAASDPVVATDGSRFLVGWSDVNEQVYLTRVDTDDSLHTDSAMVGDYYMQGPVNPTALAYGNGYLFVFAYPFGTTGGTLKALRADRDGHILDATPIPISGSSPARNIADVIWTGTQYLVVWNQGQGDGGEADAARVLADGTVLDASGFFVATLGGFSHRPRLAFGGGKVLLVAGRNAGSTGGGIDAVLLDADGGNARRVSLPASSSPLGTASAAAAWNGSAFVVTWIEGALGRPVAARVAPDGTVTDSTSIALVTGTNTQAQTPVIGASGSTANIVYVDTSYQAPPVRLVSLSATGVVSNTNTPLDVSSAPQRLLATARGTGHTLIVWADDGQGTTASALLAARVSDDGVVLDATPIVLSAAAPNKQGALAAAGWTGGQYLVSWWERTSLTTDQFQVARVSAAGELLDSTPTVLAKNVFFSHVSAIVGGSDRSLVVWSESGIISTPPPINAVFIGPDGKPVGATFSIGPAGKASYPWAVAAAEGGGYLAAWNRFDSGPNLGVEMEPIDAAGVQGSPVHVSPQQGSMSLALAPSPGRTLLWMNGRAGMLLSPAPPFTPLSGMTPFDVNRNIGVPSWNGSTYVSAGIASQGIYDFDSAGVNVSLLTADGVLLDPPTTIVAPGTLTTLAPTAIALAQNKNLVVYSRLVPEHDHGTLRVRFQIVDTGGASTPDGGPPMDGGVDADGSTTDDGGGVTDGPGDAIDEVIVFDAPNEGTGADSASADTADDSAGDTSASDGGGADVATGSDARPDVIADAGAADTGRPDAGGAFDASAPRDAATDAGRGSSSGCSCALSPTGAPLHEGEAAALLMVALAACVVTRRGRRGRGTLPRCS